MCRISEVGFIMMWKEMRRQAFHCTVLPCSSTCSRRTTPLQFIPAGAVHKAHGWRNPGSFRENLSTQIVGFKSSLPLPAPWPLLLMYLKITMIKQLAPFRQTGGQGFLLCSSTSLPRIICEWGSFGQACTCFVVNTTKIRYYFLYRLKYMRNGVAIYERNFAWDRNDCQSIRLCK